MKIKNIKKGKFIMLGAILLAVSCFSFKNKDEKKDNENVIVSKPIVYEMNETVKTLNTYNSYLEAIGSKTRLTYYDLLKLKKQNLITIKTAYHYIEVDKHEFIVYENSKGSIELGLEEYSKEDRTEIGTLEKFIAENEIDSVGISVPRYIGWSSEQEEYVMDNYNEEVFLCLQENGFPVECYDIYDLYNANNLKRTKSNE